MSDLAAEFGQIDIYVFDQLLRGRIAPGMRVLDAGCGGGRNLVYFFRNGYEIFGVDSDPGAIASVRAVARRLAPELPESNFRAEPIEQMTFPDAFADVVLAAPCSTSRAMTRSSTAMVREMWRVLKPGGLLFCRLASDIGMETRVEPDRRTPAPVCQTGRSATSWIRRCSST